MVKESYMSAASHGLIYVSLSEARIACFRHHLDEKPLFHLTIAKALNLTGTDIWCWSQNRMYKTSTNQSFDPINFASSISDRYYLRSRPVIVARSVALLDGCIFIDLLIKGFAYAVAQTQLTAGSYYLMVNFSWRIFDVDTNFLWVEKFLQHE